MNRLEHLLTILAEEADEVGQRVSKAKRFGLEEVQPGQELCNRERLEEELRDLFEMARMLEDEGHLTDLWREPKPLKRAKVERYLELSRQCGTLQE